MKVQISSHVLWTNESHFTQTGTVNTHNIHISLGLEKPAFYMTAKSKVVTQYVGRSARKFYYSSVSPTRMSYCCNILHAHQQSSANATGQHLSGQNTGLPPYLGCWGHNIIHNNFHSQLISQGEQIHWLPWSLRSKPHLFPFVKKIWRKMFTWLHPSDQRTKQPICTLWWVESKMVCSRICVNSLSKKYIKGGRRLSEHLCKYKSSNLIPLCLQVFTAGVQCLTSAFECEPFREFGVNQHSNKYYSCHFLPQPHTLLPLDSSLLF
jgi:hypothetical protein